MARSKRHPPTEASEPRTSSGHKPTRNDVARLAKVSVATVSRVFSSASAVSEDFRARVIDAANQLGYSPNLVMRGLRRGRTDVFGLVVPDILNPYYAKVCHRFVVEARNRGYDVFVRNTIGCANEEQTAIELLSMRQVDGMLVVSSGNGSDWDKLREITERLTIPIIFHGAPPSQPVSKVQLDHRLIAKVQFDFLIGRGHKVITHIASWSHTPNQGSLHEARDGCRMSLEEHALPAEDGCFLNFPEFSERAGEILDRALARRPRPTALAIPNNMVAVEICREIVKRGIQVPDELDLVGGFRELQFNPFGSTPIWSAAVPDGQIIRHVIDRLVHLIHHPSERKQIHTIVFTPTIERVY